MCLPLCFINCTNRRKMRPRLDSVTVRASYDTFFNLFFYPLEVGDIANLEMFVTRHVVTVERRWMSVIAAVNATTLELEGIHPLSGLLLVLTLGCRVLKLVLSTRILCYVRIALFIGSFIDVAPSLVLWCLMFLFVLVIALTADLSILFEIGEPSLLSQLGSTSFLVWRISLGHRVVSI